MRTAPQILHTDAPLRLTHHVSIGGHGTIEFREATDERGYTGLTLIALHDLPCRVAHLVEVGNAILAGRRVVILPEDRDAEHAASPSGRLAAEVEGDAGFPLVAELLDPTEARRAGNRDIAEALDGAAARELEPHL